MAPLSPAHRQGCARLGMMRLNAARLNVYEPVALASILGVVVQDRMRIEGASVQQVLNEQVDTGNFRVHGAAPVAGQTIGVFSGDWHNRLFAGRILETTQVYESRKQNVAHDLRCVDPTWLLNRRTVLASYVGQSATAIVLDLIARFARNVTVKNVAAGLPVIDEISFQNDYLPLCLTAVCERIGANWYLDYFGDLHVFLSETPDANTITDAAPHGAADFTLTEDLSQVATKVIGRGGGGQVAIDLPAGNAQLPVDTAVWYPDAGGIAEIGTQIINYTGVRGRAADTGAATAGALLGVGNAPPAPSVWRANNGAVGVGVYGYGLTFVTAAGETGAGPQAQITVNGAAYTQVQTPTIYQRTGGTSGMVPGGTYQFKWEFNYIGGWSAHSPARSMVVNGANYDIYVGVPAGVESLLTYHFPELAPSQGPLNHISIYRTTNGGSAFYLDTQFTADTFFARGAGYWFVGTNITDAELVTHAPQNPPGGNFNAVWLTDLAVAPGSAVTSRKVYRTAANGAQLKLLATIPNNTATTFYDDKADAALGANAPTSDTSGLTDNRSVPAGATEIPVSSTAPFTADGGASGGWVRVGNVPVRYTAVGAGALTGVPATGVGALSAPARYGTQVLVQPRLIGVTGLLRDIKQGDTVTIRIEKIDAAARDVMANRLQVAGQPVNAEDGIIEIVVGDSGFTVTELQDHVDATLQDRKDPRRTVTFTSRDLSLEVGRLVTIAVAQPPINGTFRIQRITLSEIAISGGRATVHPLKTIEASNKLYKFTDLLRRLRSAEGTVR